MFEHVLRNLCHVNEHRTYQEVCSQTLPVLICNFASSLVLEIRKAFENGIVELLTFFCAMEVTLQQNTQLGRSAAKMSKKNDKIYGNVGT